jgi:hyperosmotically inducible periplasmic protein
MFGSRNEPEIRYETSTSCFALIGAMGIGAALMYFLDPDSGRRRRARTRDQYVHGKTVVQDAAQSAVRSAANQTRGVIARVQGSLAARGEDAVDDVVLGERVRAAMGHVIADPHAIEIRVNDGTVTLKGPALPHEIGEIVACAERVRGVRQVENRLSVSSPN